MLAKIRKEIQPPTPIDNTEQIQLVLEACNNDLELAGFFVDWLNNGHNATDAYLTIHPEVTRPSAAVLGARILRKVNKVAIMQAYGLTPDLYFKNLYDGANATQWNDFTGKEEPDHRARKPYHDKLGQHLEYETKDANISQQNNIVIVTNDLSSKYGDATPSSTETNIPQQS